MDIFKETIFIREIALQSKIALKAIERLNSTKVPFDKLEIWSSIQLILVATANVSKILWPVKIYESRGEKLRKLLNVDENNPLSNRKFRNHFEHYDERIEEWFDNQSSAVYRDLDISAFESFWGDTNHNKNREYNPLKQAIIFRGETFDLKTILYEIQEILEKCRTYTLI